MSHEIEALTHRIKSLELERDLWKTQAYAWAKHAGKPYTTSTPESREREALEHAQAAEARWGKWAARYEVAA